ncbi:MAG: hypothetical protein IBX40_08940 [Methanosarcinales archaeon]|nr:hypothetical protein [Methanosarcinales archaeon]
MAALHTQQLNITPPTCNHLPKHPSTLRTPKPAEIIEKRLPAPTPQEQAESDQDGHLGRVNRRGR